MKWGMEKARHKERRQILGMHGKPSNFKWEIGW